MTKENDYKTSSGSELQDKFRNTVSIPQNIRGELAKAGDTIRDAEQTAATALALHFLLIGIDKISDTDIIRRRLYQWDRE